MTQSVSQHTYPYSCPTGRWTMTATVLASSMAFIDTTALNVILPALQKDFSASGVDLFWVLNSYLLMLAALIILGGSLGDKLGRVRVFKYGIILFIAGSIACGFSPSILFLIIARAVQGIGGAFMIPGSLAIISAVFDPKEKGKAIGTWSAATTVVTICGPVLGGALADAGLWRMIFFINVPLGILAIGILHFKVPESRESLSPKIDWWGAIVLVLSLFCFTFGLLEMPELGWDHALVLGSLAVGFILMVLFVMIENRSTHPMIPLNFFLNTTFTGVNLLTFFLYAGLGGLMLFLSLNIIQIQGYTQVQAGLTFLPFSLVMVLLARRMGKYTDRFGAKTFLIAGPLITAIGMFWFAQIGMTDGPSDYWITFFPPMLLFSIGMSITVVPLTTTVMNCLDASQSGIASGINNSITRISGTFINAIFGALAVVLFTQFTAQALIDFQELDESTTQLILQESNRLGEATVPHYVSPVLVDSIDFVYKNAFLYTYKILALICSGLAFLSSGIAVIMIRNKEKS